MILSGIADEADVDINVQIKAHQELGWNSIELRCVNGLNVAGDLDEKEFDNVEKKIKQAGLTVTCFASAIGNWSRHVNDDFSKDVNELKTAAGRMQRLGTKYIRTMSWVGTGTDSDLWRDEAIKRYQELVKIAADSDIYLAHENCTGWGGLNGSNMKYMYDAIDSKHFVILFDIGNPVSHGGDSWEFYCSVKDLIQYVHIKDCRIKMDGSHSNDFTFPGCGDANVREILKDLKKRGYSGYVSIEPHIGAIANAPDGKPIENERFESYLKYGRMASKIVRELD